MPRQVHSTNPGGGGGGGQGVDQEADVLVLSRVRGSSANTLDEVYDLITGVETTELERDQYYGIKFEEQASDTSFTLTDPSGWVNPSSVASPGYWGSTLPAKTTLVLPAGRYAWRATAWYTLADTAAGVKPEDSMSGTVLWEYALDPVGGSPIDDGRSVANSGDTPEVYAAFSILKESSNRATVYNSGTFGIGADDTVVLPYVYFYAYAHNATLLRWLRFNLMLTRMD